MIDSKQFKKQALPYLEGLSIPRTDWEWLIVGQHYGLPTMLLDWTRNPLCALYFAIRENKEDRDGIVYVYHHAKLAIDIENYCHPTKIFSIELIEPPHVTPRVIAQDSVFTAVPLFYKRDDTWKESVIVREWHVCAGDVMKIRDELNELGINEGSLFPNLEKVCCDLKRVLNKNFLSK